MEITEPEARSRQRTARLILSSFLITFTFARVLVLLIMSRRIPDLYLHLGGTHVHHFNYGIALLSAVGAYLLLAQPTGRIRSLTAAVYGVGLALTFDEFGMWINLGGSYWQRASFDAVIVIATLFGLLAVAPRLRQLRLRHWAVLALIVAATATCALLWADVLHRAEQRIGPALRELEERGPT